MNRPNSLEDICNHQWIKMGDARRHDCEDGTCRSGDTSERCYRFSHGIKVVCPNCELIKDIYEN